MSSIINPTVEGPWFVEPYKQRQGYFWVGSVPGDPMSRFVIGTKEVCDLVASAPELLDRLTSIAYLYHGCMCLDNDEPQVKFVDCRNKTCIENRELLIKAGAKLE